MIKTDPLHKIAYSTDASAYREIPYGVAYPTTVEDIQTLISEAKRLHTYLIPRAAGTSIAGQVVGRGIIVDIKSWNKILEINKEEKWARVQPGIIRDELNIALRPYGLFFSPETSTSNRCCIGGMFGNNSCGTHSLVYGSTRHHVIACKGVLSDGSLFDTERLDSANPLINNIISQLKGWANDSTIIAQMQSSFPDKSITRRSCGYAIDEAIEDGNIDICKLLVGSEGTLAIITEIKISLDLLPPSEKLVVCAHCDTLDKSFHANLVALKFNPSAVELMDGKIIELSTQNIEQERNTFFIEGNPAALVIVEFWGKSIDEINLKAESFELAAKESGLVYACTRVYGESVAKVWNLRKAGLGVLNGMKGDAKPIGVIEDTAVAVNRLPEYMKDFQIMLKRLGVSCVYYGHISTGELHLRPIINIKTEEGKNLFRDIAFETAKLVKKHKGCLSGEHGDGRLRGEFIPLMYGDVVYQMMCEVKHTWDPDNVFNMHKIIDTPPMDEWLRYEVNQLYAIENELDLDKTYYNWKATFDECKVEGVSGVKSQVHALMCSIEQCNGAGACLKSNLIGGTMCPVYKLLRDEIQSTRGRANILRELLTKGFKSEVFLHVKQGKSIFEIPELESVLNSCLACKGCKSECSSNVDISKLRSEILQQKYDNTYTPLRTWLVARMAKIEDIGALFRPIYNFFVSCNMSSWFIKKILRFSVERRLPTLSRYSMRVLVREEQNKMINSHPIKKEVYLFADEFTNRHEAEIGLMFAKLLMRLGYKVEIPEHVESGRAAISKGCLRLAKKYTRKNVMLLKDIVSENKPLLGIEPSCILSFRDEYPDLIEPNLREEAKILSKNCLLFDEFISNEIQEGRITKDSFKELNAEIFLHGHCHQKTLIGVGKCVEILGLIPGVKVNVIPSGCCGMAGSYGYEKEHYKTSMEIGNMVLFPAIKAATSIKERKIIVAAPGTSCRQQIKDGTGVSALHPIEILYQYLK